jgi:hypothetical protein
VSAATSTVTINSAKIMQMMQASPAEFFSAFKQAANDIGRRYKGYHSARRLRGIGAETAGKGVRGTRQGFLTRAARYMVAGTNCDNLTMTIKWINPIAVMHEVGALMTPRKAQFMTIPMAQAVDKWGRKTAKAKALFQKSRDIWRAYQFGADLYGHKGPSKSGKTPKPKQQTGLFPIRRKSDGKVFLVTSNRVRADRSKSLRKISHKKLNRWNSTWAKEGTATGEFARFREKLTFWFHLAKSAQLKPRLDFEMGRGIWERYYNEVATKRFISAVKGAISAARKKAAVK